MPEDLFPPGISSQEWRSKALGPVISLQMDPEEAPARVWGLQLSSCTPPGLGSRFVSSSGARAQSQLSALS